MKIIHRLVGRSFLFNTLSVCLVLVGLFSFLELVNQLDSIGEGRYRLADALVFVVFSVPGRILEMAPASVLLGSIVTLGGLVESQELVAMKAGGIAPRQVAWAILQPGLLVALGLLVMAQLVSPPLEQAGWIRREEALSAAGTLLPRGGFWSRTTEGFTAVRSANPDGTLSGVDLYRFGPEGMLEARVHGDTARVLQGGRWQLMDVVVQEIGAEGSISSRSLEELTLDSLLTGKQVRMLGLPPELLSLTDLFRFIRTLEVQDQNATRYRLALWQKLNLPLSMAAMILLSFPFALGPPRGASLGWRIMVGAIVGLAYYYLHKVLAYTGLLLEWSPALLILLPTALVLVLAVLVLRRVT